VPVTPWRLRSDAVEVGVTAVGGMLDAVRLRTERGSVEPMHRAPWVDDPPPAVPMLQHHRGDFFCAPFGASASERLRLSFAPYRWGATPPHPVESAASGGRSLLASPQAFERLERVRAAAGGTVDLSRFATIERSEEGDRPARRRHRPVLDLVGGGRAARARSGSP
jgi:hypothetical protein